MSRGIQSLGSPGKHSATLQLLHEGCSFTQPPLSITTFSVIQLSEMWQRGMNEIAQDSKRKQEEWNAGSLC